MSSINTITGTHDVVSAQAMQSPFEIAIRHQNKSMSYAELEIRSNQLAHLMIENGLTKGAVVGVCLPPSVNLVVTMLAVWKAGAVYLPLEMDYPIERLLEITEESGSRFLVGISTNSYLFKKSGTVILNLDIQNIDIDSSSKAPLTTRVHSDDIAYLMYTSGSTGKPKGVMVPHSALVNKLVQPGTWGKLTSECRSALLTSIAFDPSLVQILLPLAHGGNVLLVDTVARLDPALIWKTLREANITILDCTPSWLQIMLAHDPEGYEPQRIVMGGEILTPVFARRVQEAFPHAQLVNIYGPTEACVDATAHELQPEDFDAVSIPIGKALPGYHLRVVGDEGSSTVDGEVGELQIGGLGLARGYWRNPIATSQAFISGISNTPERWYRSGDQVRQLENNVIDYIGRSDNQIKLRGQRIELNEIENILAQMPQVVSAVVKVWPTNNGNDKRLVGYVVAQTKQETSDNESIAKEIHLKLSERLPSYMVPSSIEVLDSLPLTNTGKVDRAALPQPVFKSSSLSEQDLPKNDVETELVQLWSQQLQIDQIGIHDNFFDLGGNSLSAVQLIVAMNKQFDTKLPLTSLLTHPTVADFAIALVRGQQSLGADDSNDGRAITLGTRPEGVAPLFFLPPRSGVGLIYVGLARELSGVTPSIALQTVNFSCDKAGSITMQQLVTELIDDIEQIQPEGDVRLCGYSAGGPVAYEMVRQLEAKGRSVSHLILIDPFCADHSDWPDSQPPRTDLIEFWSICRDMIADATSLRGATADPVLDVAQRLWLEVLSQGISVQDPEIQPLLDDAKQALPEHIDLDIFMLLLEGVGNLWHACIKHTLEPLPAFSGQTLFIQPDHVTEDFRVQRMAHWEELLGSDIQQLVVPGEHDSMLSRARTVSAIGAHLRSIFGRKNQCQYL